MDTELNNPSIELVRTGTSSRRIRPDDVAISDRISYTIAEFAALNGMCRQSVYNAVARGEIKALKFGGSLRIPRSELDRLFGAVGRCDACGGLLDPVHEPGRFRHVACAPPPASLAILARLRSERERSRP
jgi:excisionase family DNA binding protein